MGMFDEERLHIAQFAVAVFGLQRFIAIYLFSEGAGGRRIGNRGDKDGRDEKVNARKYSAEEYRRGH